jgi:hypothetical protein
VGRHTAPGRVRHTPTRTPTGRRLLLPALGVTATFVAWGLLVLAAIDFGGQARAGSSLAWAFLALATVGATACLFLTLILGARLVGALGARGSPAPPDPHPVGGRRAARRAP